MKQNESGKALEDWIYKNLFHASYYEPFDQSGKPILGHCSKLYSTELNDSFVLSIIDGYAAPSRFRYRNLQQAIFQITGKEECHWFYIFDPDNAFSLMEYKGAARPETQYSTTHQLELFETQPAREGGNSYLLLVGTSKTWILEHAYSPGNDFALSFHGSPELCTNLLSILNIAELP